MRLKQFIIDAFFKGSKAEINEHTMKLLVGLIAISLAVLTNYFSSEPLQSISASYHEGGWPRDIFVGFLFAISAFLFSYNGKPPLERQKIRNRFDEIVLSQCFQRLLSKIASVSAFGIAMFPCRCGSHPEIIPGVHGFSALVMFICLAIFCYVFYKRASVKSHPDAKKRAVVYAFCGSLIVLSILAIAVHNVVSDQAVVANSRITFWGEFVALLAFGTSWMIASQKLLMKNNYATDSLLKD